MTQRYSRRVDTGENFSSVVPDVIVTCRMAKGITQVQLAEMVDTTQGYISLVESSTANPTAETLSKIFNCLDISVVLEWEM